MTRSDDRGVILVNVLVALALGAALVTLMLNSQDVDMERARRAAALAQAEGIALGAETSVVVALRRDMVDAPETDHLAEDWAMVAQQEVLLGTGRFSVTLHDAQSRLNLGNLRSSSIVGQQVLARLVAVLGLPPETTVMILSSIATPGPLFDLADIPGLTDRTRKALAPHVAFLPEDAGINLNSAGAEIIAAVVGNTASASQLLQIRTRNGGFLNRSDLIDAGVLGTPGADLTSDTWDAEIQVEVDDVTLVLTSRIVRLRSVNQIDVVVHSRRFGAKAPSDLVAPDAALWLSQR